MKKAAKNVAVAQEMALAAPAPAPSAPPATPELKVVERKIKLEIVPDGGKFLAMIDDKVAHRAGSQGAAQITLDRNRKQMGWDRCFQVGLGSGQESHADADHTNLVVPALNVSIHKRFEMMGDLMTMVALGHYNTAVITGPGGLGKSFEVRRALEAAGLKDYDELLAGLEIGSVLRHDQTYKYIKGYSTAKGLYRSLFENNNSVIVYDDCDDIQKDKTAMMLLKTALDTETKRIISWNSEPIGGSDLPTSFQFDGRVIFISNMSMRNMDQALKTRGPTIDLAMTRDQMVERLEMIAKSEKFLPKIELEEKLIALELVKEYKDVIPDINIRSLILAATNFHVMRNWEGKDWKETTIYMLTNTKNGNH